MLKKFWNFWKGTVRSEQKTENAESMQAEAMSRSEDSEPLVVEIVEKKETLSPLSIATYRDLLNIDQNRPLPTEAEYPPLPRKIKAISIDEIMAIYAVPIRQAADDLPMSEEEIDDFFIPVIRRALTYMHLLPASQFNHHNGVGGLFAHSLQVGSTAIQIGKRKVFNRRDTPRQLYNNGKRWLFGCWLSGFLHDIGKPATDVIVTADGETWYANAESLTHWLALNNKTEYSFIWKSGGHHKHQQSALFFVNEIVSPETFAWLAAYGSREIWDSCEIALTNPDYTGPNSLIAEVVKQSDQIVSGEDIKQRNAGLIDSRKMGGGLPAAEFILDAIRLLLSEKKLEVNAKRSFLFVTNIGTFLIWSTSTSDRLYERVLEDKHTSVPKQIDRMLDCLISGGVIEPAPEEISPASRYYWPLIVDPYPSKVFRAVKLRSNFSIFNGLVAPEPCLAIINGYSENPPEVLSAWESRHGKMLDDKALASHDEDLTIGAVSSELATVSEPDAQEVNEAAYEEYARDNPREEEPSTIEPEQTTEVFKAELLQFLQVPNEKKEQDADETVDVKPCHVLEKQGLVLDSSVLAPPSESACSSSDDENDQKEQVSTANGLGTFLPSMAEQTCVDKLPIRTITSDEEERRPTIAVLDAPSETDCSPLPSSGEEINQTERVKEEVAEELIGNDAVINEEVYKTTLPEGERTYGSKENALKRGKALKTLRAKDDEDAERDPVVINGEEKILVSSNGGISIESEPSQPSPLQTIDEATAERASPDPQSWPLKKKLSYLRRELIDGLLNESRAMFPDGVVRLSDSEYSANAAKLFERATQLGLDYVKVKKLQTGFQPDSWKISFCEEEHQLTVSIRRREEQMNNADQK